MTFPNSREEALAHLKDHCDAWVNWDDRSDAPYWNWSDVINLDGDFSAKDLECLLYLRKNPQS